MKRKDGKIAIAMISDDNFIMPTCVTIASLLENKDGSSYYDIYVLMAECSLESEKRINEFQM